MTSQHHHAAHGGDDCMNICGKEVETRENTIISIGTNESRPEVNKRNIKTDASDEHARAEDTNPMEGERVETFENGKESEVEKAFRVLDETLGSLWGPQAKPIADAFRSVAKALMNMHPEFKQQLQRTQKQQQNPSYASILGSKHVSPAGVPQTRQEFPKRPNTGNNKPAQIRSDRIDHWSEH